MTSVPPEEPREFAAPPDEAASPDWAGAPPDGPNGPQGPTWDHHPDGGATHPVTNLRNGLGTAALVVGILSLVCTILLPPVGVVLGILGLVFGIIGVRRVRRGEATNRGQAMAGWITGAAGLVISVALLAVVGSFIFSHRHQIDTYTRCLQNAHTQHARDVCQTQFQNSIRGR